MYFDLTETQKAIAEQVRTVLRANLPDDRLVPAFDRGELDGQLFAALGGLGLGALMVPEEQDGLGLDLLTLAAIAEALGETGAAVPIVNNVLAAWLLAVFGSDDQRARWLLPLVEGRSVAAFALAEPESAWQPEQWRLAGPRATGVKQWVEWGAEADLLFVGTAGGDLMLALADGKGLSRTSVPAVDRNRPLAEIRFDGAELEAFAGVEVAERLRDALLVLLAADACGAARRALDMAVEYAKIRTQFDQLIGAFQGLKHQLANIAAEVEPCRPLFWYAAYAWDAIPERRSHAAAVAKAHITEIAVASARRAVEAHGGIGYTWEYPLHVFLKRAMFDRAAMGLPAVHRTRAAALAGW